MLKPKSRIYSFEVNRETFKKLKSYYDGIENINLYNIGLGSKEEKKFFYIPVYRNYIFDGHATFNKKYAEEIKKWVKNDTKIKRILQKKHFRKSSKKIFNDQ